MFCTFIIVLFSYPAFELQVCLINSVQFSSVSAHKTRLIYNMFHKVV